MCDERKMTDHDDCGCHHGRHDDTISDHLCSAARGCCVKPCEMTKRYWESDQVNKLIRCPVTVKNRNRRLKTWLLVVLGIMASSGHGPPVVQAGRRFGPRSLQRSPMYDKDINRDQFFRRWLSLNSDYNSIQPTIRPSAYLEPSPQPALATTAPPSYHYYHQDQHHEDLPRPSFDDYHNYNQQISYNQQPGSNIHQQSQQQQAWGPSAASSAWEQFTVNANNLPPALSRPVYQQPTPMRDAYGRPGFTEVNQVPEPFTSYTETKVFSNQHQNNPPQSGQTVVTNSHQQPSPITYQKPNEGGSRDRDKYKVIVNVKPAYERFYIGSHVNPLNVRRKEKSLLVLNFVEANNNRGKQQHQQWKEPFQGHPGTEALLNQIRQGESFQHSSQQPAMHYSSSQQVHAPMSTRDTILDWLKGSASSPGQTLQDPSPPSLKSSTRLSKHFEGGDLQLKNTLKAAASMSAPVVYDFAKAPTTPSSLLASFLATTERPTSPAMMSRFQVTPESATALIGKPPFGTIVNNLPSFAGLHQLNTPATADSPSQTTLSPMNAAAAEGVTSATIRPYLQSDETAGRYDRNPFFATKINQNQFSSDFPTPISNNRPQYQHRTTTTTLRPWPTENLQFVKTSPTAGYAAAPKVPTFVSYNGSPMPSHSHQQTVTSSYLQAFLTTTTPAPPVGHYGTPSRGTNQAGSGYLGNRQPTPQAQVQPHAMLSYAQPYNVQTYEPDRLSDVIDAYKPPTSTASYQQQQSYRERTTTSTQRPWPEQIWNRPDKIFYFGKQQNNNNRKGLSMFGQDYANQMLDQMEAAQPQQGVSMGVGATGSHLAPSAWAKAYLQHAVAAGELTKHAIHLPRPSFAQAVPEKHTHGYNNPYQQRNEHSAKKIVTRAEVQVETTVSPWVYETFHKIPVSQEWTSRKLQKVGWALPDAVASMMASSQKKDRWESGRTFGYSNKPVQDEKAKDTTKQQQQEQRPAGAVQYFTAVTKFTTVKNGTDDAANPVDNPKGFSFYDTYASNGHLEEFISTLDDDVRVNLVDLLPKRIKHL